MGFVLGICDVEYDTAGMLMPRTVSGAVSLYPPGKDVDSVLGIAWVLPIFCSLDDGVDSDSAYGVRLSTDDALRRRRFL